MRETGPQSPGRSGRQVELAAAERQPSRLGGLVGDLHREDVGAGADRRRRRAERAPARSLRAPVRRCSPLGAPSSARSPKTAAPASRAEAASRARSPVGTSPRSPPSDDGPAGRGPRRATAGQASRHKTTSASAGPSARDERSGAVAAAAADRQRRAPRARRAPARRTETPASRSAAGSAARRRRWRRSPPAPAGTGAAPAASSAGARAPTAIPASASPITAEPEGVGERLDRAVMRGEPGAARPDQHARAERSASRAAGSPDRTAVPP